MLMLLAVGCVAAAHAAPEAGPETQVKAAYVLNFLKYTYWPAERDPVRREGEYVVAVIGAESFAQSLRDIGAQAEGMGQRHVTVWRLEPSEIALPEVQKRIDGSHAVFIAADTPGDTRALLERLGRRPLLTIGDASDFAAAGGMLGLVPSGKRIVFDANPTAIHAHGLRVSAKVLKLSRIVERRP